MRRYGRACRDGGMADEARRASKLLSYWLRHRPDAAGIALDGAGWAEVEGVLAALGRAGAPADRAALERVVAESDKNRFELSPDGSRLRARQGHSVAVDAGWTARRPPDRLYHGTVERFLPSILRDGLRPGARHHVHLSPDVGTARAVGARRGAPVVLEVDAGAMAAAGAAFLLAGNGVWLVDYVPPDRLKRLDG